MIQFRIEYRYPVAEKCFELCLKTYIKMAVLTQRKPSQVLLLILSKGFLMISRGIEVNLFA